MKRTLKRIRLLQCLSTFHDPHSYSRSTIALRMLAEYTGLSLCDVEALIEHLASYGYVAVSPCGRAARLDVEAWRCFSSPRKTYYAYFVANAPAELRDRQSLQPARAGCYVHPRDDGGCSTTVATTFDGVYNTHTSRESCCPPEEPEPVELVFEDRLCLCPKDSAVVNLWYLRSAFGSALFRRLLLALYLTGQDGRAGVELLRQDALLLCMSDDVFEDDDTTDLIVRGRGHDCGVQTYCSLGGRRVVLDADCGLAYLGTESAGRIYRERGCAGGVRLVELAAAQRVRNPHAAIDRCT